MNIKNTKVLAEKILDLIQNMPDDAVEKLLAAWDSGNKVTKYNAGQITGISGDKINRLVMLIADPSLSPELLYSLFVVGLEAKSRFTENTNEIEIVWTGPNKINMGIRNTKPVIEGMLKSANPGEKVTIIDYVITSNAESIVDELKSCLKDGVEIDLIVDNNRANERELRKCFAEKSLTRPTIYTRKEKESKYYKVHAKTIIIGDREMLVSSANLTELGTEVNFELGLLVRGPVVKDMVSLITRMIDDKYFEESD
jgi:phosphatidylserine/phosphatidylglycerophosphate/cardiolipin synthase-like enzyme